LVFGGG